MSEHVSIRNENPMLYYEVTEAVKVITDVIDLLTIIDNPQSNYTHAQKHYVIQTCILLLYRKREASQALIADRSEVNGIPF